MSGRAGAERVRAVSVGDLLEMKRRGEAIVALNAFGYLLARPVDEFGVDVALVGESPSQVVPGLPPTLPVTLEDVIRNASAVRGTVRRSGDPAGA